MEGASDSTSKKMLDKIKSNKATRSRSGSLSEGTSAAGSSSRPRTLTTTSTDLQGEAARMAQVAGTAADKAAAHQRKMTDYVGRRVPSPAPSGGAGELPSGPCGPTAADKEADKSQAPSATGTRPGSGSGATAAAIDQLLQQSRRDGDAAPVLQAVELLNKAISPGPGVDQEMADKSEEQDEEQEENWQVWSTRKNRCVGADMGVQEQRQVRERTPFQLPGGQTADRRGYYTSTNRRNIAYADSRASKPSAVATLTDEQWHWFREHRCLGCGGKHQVKDCPQLTAQEARALRKAVFNCPVDMRPGQAASGRRVPPLPQGPGGRSATPSAATRTAATAAAGAATASMTPGSSRMAPAGAAKRDRETERTGLTPEAKKAKMFSEAVKSNLVLHVREKDGAPLTKERFQALKTSFTYYVEDMLEKNKDPPICAGRWQESRSVVKIPMASEEDMLWMRCFLDKAYLVQSEKEFRESKRPTYVAFLRDRLEPELTNMRQDKLAFFVKYFKRQANITGLFELKMAAKTTRGKAVHLLMDEDAESIFVKAGCKIPFAASGWIHFEERQAYVARIKAQERERLRPRASDLEQGRAAHGVQNLRLDDDDEVVVLEPEKEKNPPAAGEAEQLEEIKDKYARTLARTLRQSVQEGSLDQQSAEAKMLEETGRTLAELTPKRTTSGSSWYEEVEHMKGLDKSQTQGTAVNIINDDDDRDQAQFELHQEQDAQGPGHRAAGSGQPAEGAERSPSGC